MAHSAPNNHSWGQLCFQGQGDVIKNPFWWISNLNYDFISLELIILERENTKEAKLFDKNDVSKTNGKDLEDGTSCIRV